MFGADAVWVFPTGAVCGDGGVWHLAKSYYVDGERGEVKKIVLPRNLVVWE